MRPGEDPETTHFFRRLTNVDHAVFKIREDVLDAIKTGRLLRSCPSIWREGFQVSGAESRLFFCIFAEDPESTTDRSSEVRNEGGRSPLSRPAGLDVGCSTFHHIDCRLRLRLRQSIAGELDVGHFHSKSAILSVIDSSTVDYVYDLRDSITRGSDMVYIQSKFAISSAIEDRGREARASRISPKALSGVEGHLISPHCLLSHSPLHQSPDIIFNDLNILLVRRIDHPKRPLVLKGVWILKAVRFFSFSSKPLRMSERDSPPGTRKDW